MMNSPRPIPQTPSRGLTARDLFARSDNRIVQGIVQDQIILIDSSIQTAHNSGFCKIQHELPTNFSINSMSKADAQTMIYSELLMIYKNPESDGGKGFDNVYIDVGIKSFLHISWSNGMDDNERDRRNKYIVSCLISKKY